MAWNFADLWESLSDALSERVVLVQGDRRVTWRDFDERAARLAADSPRGVGLALRKVASYLCNSNRGSEGVYDVKMRASPPRTPYRGRFRVCSTTPDAGVLFHGELGDGSPRSDAGPEGVLWIQVDDGCPAASRSVRGAVGRARADGLTSARATTSLPRGGTTDAEGRHVAQ